MEKHYVYDSGEKYCPASIPVATFVAVLLMASFDKLIDCRFFDLQVADLQEEATSLFEKVSAAEEEVRVAEVRALALADKLKAAQASPPAFFPAIVHRYVCMF